MVLQDLDSASESFSDNPYPSENDPYASSSSGRSFDASSLPQPIPVLGPLLGFSSAAVRFKTESTIKFAERRVHRQLSPEEAQALASHLYKLEQTKSYFTAVGAGIGTWRWYNTFQSCRYPLYLPKPEDINPNKFLFVRGPMAHYARHSWRLLLYMFVAGEMGKLLGQLTAQPLAAQNTANDPNLAQFAADLKSSISSDTARARGNREQLESEWKQRIEREKNAREATRSGRMGDSSFSEAPSRKPWSRQNPTPTDDDMSPTAGNEPWPSTSENSWGGSDFSEPQQSAPARRQSAPSTNAWQRRQQRPDDDDDASPTGGLFQDEVQSQPRYGGSAWERLRRGGAKPPVQQRPTSDSRGPPYQEQREGSTLGDGFAFSETEDERKKAQERAQREFDARIQRERQGKDFNEESRRW